MWSSIRRFACRNEMIRQCNIRFRLFGRCVPNFTPLSQTLNKCSFNEIYRTQKSFTLIYNPHQIAPLVIEGGILCAVECTPNHGVSTTFGENQAMKQSAKKITTKKTWTLYIVIFNHWSETWFSGSVSIYKYPLLDKGFSHRPPVISVGSRPHLYLRYCN